MFVLNPAQKQILEHLKERHAKNRQADIGLTIRSFYDFIADSQEFYNKIDQIWLCSLNVHERNEVIKEFVNWAL
ncbi:hypothetical protein [Listeria costaricensis]|uniref:hypothetical protein n=1 Tax=Listeria costaricensis TaxID=2026604 RepID=UPI000C0871DB|nr:hypothetical protein [Listeria costaricensis]